MKRVLTDSLASFYVIHADSRIFNAARLILYVFRLTLLSKTPDNPTVVPGWTHVGSHFPTRIYPRDVVIPASI